MILGIHLRRKNHLKTYVLLLSASIMLLAGGIAMLFFS